MKRQNAKPGDSVTVKAKDVKDDLDVPVTAGLTGNLKVYDAADVLLSTTSITANSGDDWLARTTAPATVGLYRLELTVVVGSAQRTLEAELRVI